MRFWGQSGLNLRVGAQRKRRASLRCKYGCLPRDYLLKLPVIIHAILRVELLVNIHLVYRHYFLAAYLQIPNLLRNQLVFLAYWHLPLLDAHRVNVRLHRSLLYRLLLLLILVGRWLTLHRKFPSMTRLKILLQAYDCFLILEDLLLELVLLGLQMRVLGAQFLLFCL